MAARGETWGIPERLLLLQIWRDEDVEGQLTGVHHNTPVYDQVAARLNRNGYNRTGAQCRSKIKGLRAKWTKARDNMAKSGTSGGRYGGLQEEEWEILTEVLGNRPIHNPGSLVDTLSMPRPATGWGNGEREQDGQEGGSESDGDGFADVSTGSVQEDSFLDLDTGRPASSLSNASTASVGSAKSPKSTTKASLPSEPIPGTSTAEEDNVAMKTSVNDFSRRKRKRKFGQDLAEILQDFYKRQDQAQKEFRENEE
ncbi:uncharacterized protein LOC135497052 [Lineus longissimus]|uniref:uncharacterized protein LOC135497052 n=1 Tax=Lineus longissimus TaxID=88925 RepID=UPI002B4CA53E